MFSSAVEIKLLLVMGNGDDLFIIFSVKAFVSIYSSDQLKDSETDGEVKQQQGITHVYSTSSTRTRSNSFTDYRVRHSCRLSPSMIGICKMDREAV